MREASADDFPVEAAIALARHFGFRSESDIHRLVLVIAQIGIDEAGWPPGIAEALRSADQPWLRIASIEAEVRDLTYRSHVEVPTLDAE